jgi:hypothetical protein
MSRSDEYRQIALECIEGARDRERVAMCGVVSNRSVFWPQHSCEHATP